MAAPPFLSIVLPCRNGFEHAAAALRSVLDQTEVGVELVVADGASTDGTLDLLRRSAHDDPRLRLESGPDRGQYDALNKALSRSRGGWIGWLNIDDEYEPGSFSALAEAVERHPDAELVCGNAHVLRKGPSGWQEVLRHIHWPGADRLSFATLGVSGFSMNAWFMKRALLDRTGAFLVSDRYSMVCDRDYLIRLCLQAPTAVPLNRDIYRYRFHAGSMTARWAEREFSERINLLRDWLARKDLSGEGRRYCRYHLSTATYLLARERMRQGHALGGARDLLGAGFRNPLAFAGALSDHIQLRPTDTGAGCGFPDRDVSR